MKKVIFVGAAYAGAFFFVVWVKVAVVRRGYERRDLESQYKNLQLDLSDVEARMGKWMSLEVLSAKARERGFHLPGEYSLDKIRYAK